MTDRSKDVEVLDRRAARSTPEENPAEAAPAPEPVAEAQAPEGPAAQPAPPRREEHVPEMDFQTFLFSLATSAYVQLGLMANPETGEPEPSLPLARQTIDILGMLEEKTRGNLTEEEAAMLQQWLFELRMQYVELSSGPSSR